MTTLHIMGDIDDVFFPWFDGMHQRFLEEGIATSPTPPANWRPYEEYGISADRWFEGIGRAVTDGFYEKCEPIEGSVAAWNRLRWELGDRVQLHMVTARGMGREPNATRIRESTQPWLEEFGIAFDTLTFTKDKPAAQRQLGVRFDAAIDDGPHNVVALDADGVRTWILSRSYNTHIDHPHRAETLSEFVDAVLKEYA